MNKTDAKIQVADYKIVLLGESSVGKSSIVERLQTNIFNDKKSSTIGAAYINKKIVVKSSIDSEGNENATKVVNLQIWDTAGQERFHNLTPLYYRNANLAIVVYDMSNFESLNKAEYWLSQLSDFPDIKVVLVGNKSDLARNIDQVKLDKLISEYEYKVVGSFETSAKNGDGVKEMFEFITQNVDENLYGDADKHVENNGLIDLNLNNQNLKSVDGCSC